MKKLFVVVFFLSSCWKSEKEAKNECFLNQVGEYQFDVQKTIEGYGNLGSYSKDSSRLRNFRIIFRKDSTFHINLKVDFFSDTAGFWQAGNCAFESPGIFKYYGSNQVEQFGPCNAGDSFFTKLAPYNKKFGSITLWFKKHSFVLPGSPSRGL